MTATHPAELTAFLAALEREPDDRTAALVLADWWEEADNPHRDPRRAEYTRVVVELEQKGPNPHHESKHWCDCWYCSRRRSCDALLRDLLALPCPGCKWKGMEIGSGDAVQAVIDWGRQRKNCPTCGGLAFRIDPSSLYGNGRAAVVRTVPVQSVEELGEVVTCHCRSHNGGTSTRMGPCRTCGDRRLVFRPSPWSLAVVAALGASFVGFRPTNLAPRKFSEDPGSSSFDGDEWWSWVDATVCNEPHGPHHIPGFLFSEMAKEHKPHGFKRIAIRFSTAHLAQTALARATKRLVVAGNQ